MSEDLNPINATDEGKEKALSRISQQLHRVIELLEAIKTNTNPRN